MASFIRMTLLKSGIENGEENRNQDTSNCDARRCFDKAIKCFFLNCDVHAAVLVLCHLIVLSKYHFIERCVAHLSSGVTCHCERKCRGLCYDWSGFAAY